VTAHEIYSESTSELPDIYMPRLFGSKFQYTQKLKTLLRISFQTTTDVDKMCFFIVGEKNIINTKKA
jgi:hypothetical protein